MRHLASASVALSSAALACIALCGATRPHYGGTVRVQLISPLPDSQVNPLTTETLVRVDERGEIQPVLARAWQSDGEKRRWRLTIRPRVVFHDGGVLTGASVAASLEPRLKALDIAVAAAGQSVTLQAEHPVPDLLETLGHAEFAVWHAAADGSVMGTGPFRMVKWEAPHRAVLAANEDYWGGRPFVDGIELNSAAPRGTAAYSLSSAEVWELPVTSSRRAIPEGMHLWTSAARELLALSIPGAQTALHDALAFSIDRAPIVNVLMQRRGEAAEGLLPQWLTGYAFLFHTAPDLTRAKQATAAVKRGMLTIGVPAGDTLARLVADRIAVNARDAGLNLQVTAQPASMQMVRARLSAASEAAALRDVAAQLGISDRLRDRVLNSPDAVYEAERALLEDPRIVPLVYVPQLFGLHPRVRGWDSERSGVEALGRLAGVWLEP